MEPLPDPGSSLDELRRAVHGDRAGVDALLERHRGRLHRMVRLRLDRRLAGRIDPSDVLQDTFLEVTRRLPEYVRDPDMPFFLWLRFLTGQKLAQLHRHHLGVQARDAGREVGRRRPPDASAESMTAAFLSHGTSPTRAAMRNELKLRLAQTLELMSARDREVLALRHFEQLTNAEVACELGIDESTASKRYVRALRRLRAVIEELPMLDDLRAFLAEE